MNLTRRLSRIVVGIGLCLAALAPALAREMVSIKGGVVNWRASPNTRSDVLWELERGYPLQVLKRQGRWLLVRDFENDRGWVYRSMTSTTPHHVVTAKSVNVRQGPGKEYRVVGQAHRYEVLRTREKKAGWVRVEGAGGLRGWIARHFLWGW